MKISPLNQPQIILEDLKSKGVIESETKGKIKVYHIKKSETAKDYLILTNKNLAEAYTQKAEESLEVMHNIMRCILHSTPF